MALFFYEKRAELGAFFLSLDTISAEIHSSVSSNLSNPLQTSYNQNYTIKLQKSQIQSKSNSKKVKSEFFFDILFDFSSIFLF